VAAAADEAVKNIESSDYEDDDDGQYEEVGFDDYEEDDQKDGKAVEPLSDKRAGAAV